MWRIGAGLLLLLGGSLSMWADSKKTTVIVEVKSESQKPVDNAAVILDFLGSHQITKLGKRKPIHWEVRTNQKGMAHFPPIPEGAIQLQIIASKYQTYGAKIDVDGEEKKIDIELKRPQNQYSAHEPLKPAEPPKKPENPKDE
jgi:hypothetical protein